MSARLCFVILCLLVPAVLMMRMAGRVNTIGDDSLDRENADQMIKLRKSALPRN